MVGLMIVFAGFLLDWFAILFHWQMIKPYAKALSLVILILWTLFVLDFNFTPLVILLFLAQLFGLAGDIFLLFSDRWFVSGLGAFLLGHICYLILIVTNLVAGYQSGETPSFSIWIWLIAVLVLLALIWIFYKVIVTILLKEKPDKIFIASLFVYAFCLSSVMVLSFVYAVLFSSGNIFIWALPFGGTLFFISDFTLAFDRFVRRLDLGQLRVMITYHLGQFLLALGFISLILGRSLQL
jgi:uncharacterized membrane protein YhhN